MIINGIKRFNFEICGFIFIMQATCVNSVETCPASQATIVSESSNTVFNSQLATIDVSSPSRGSPSPSVSFNSPASSSYSSSHSTTTVDNAFTSANSMKAYLAQHPVSIKCPSNKF
jgi:hypothetical protein